MRSLSLFAQEDLIDVLKLNADYTFLPRVGIHVNVAFPGVQLNLHGAVLDEKCRGEYQNHICALFPDHSLQKSDLEKNWVPSGKKRDTVMKTTLPLGSLA